MMPLMNHFLTSSFRTTMSPSYDGTEQDMSIELQPLGPTSLTRGPGQPVSNFEHQVQCAAPAGSGSRRSTTDSPQAISETWTKMRQALKTLIHDYDRQRDKIMATTTTNGDKPNSVEHTVPSKVREWFATSLKETRAHSRPILPPFPLTMSRYLTSRGGSKDGKVRQAVRAVEYWRESRVAMEKTANQQKEEEDKVEITKVMKSWH